MSSPHHTLSVLVENKAGVLARIGDSTEFVKSIGHSRMPPFERRRLDRHREVPVAFPSVQRLLVPAVLDQQDCQLGG